MTSKNFCDYTIQKRSPYVFVCSHPTYHDVRARELLTPTSPEGRLFTNILQERGITRDMCSILCVSRYRPAKGLFMAHPSQQLSQEIECLREKIATLKPKCVVTLGDYASWALLPFDWPTKRGKGHIKFAEGSFNMRGFVFESEYVDAPVVASVSIEDIQNAWVPWRVLLSLDVQRAKDITRKGFQRPERNVEILV